MVEVRNMSLEKFRKMHSEIIQYFQCIEYDMRRIISLMSIEDYDKSMSELKDRNWNTVLQELRKLDHSDNDPYFSDDDYKLLDEIRTQRNFWSHQCYLEFVYIQDNGQREERLQRLTKQLENEHNRALKLHKKMQKHVEEIFEIYN